MIETWPGGSDLVGCKMRSPVPNGHVKGSTSSDEGFGVVEALRQSAGEVP